MFFSCKKNIQHLAQDLHNNFDIVQKFFCKNATNLGLIYIKTIVDEQMLADAVLNPLAQFDNFDGTLECVQNNIVAFASVERATTFEQAINGLLEGKVAMFADTEDSCLLIDLQKVPVRSPSEPPTSAVIYGPRIGFTESIEQNLGMLRKRLPSPNLKISEFSVGKHTKTKVLVCHLDGVASKKTVKEIEKQIASINIDGIVDSNYIVAFFQKNNSLFKRAGIAEKPDIVTAKVLEGRVAILVDGSPIVLTLPFMVFEDLQNSNDYYTSSVYASFLRFIRLFGLFVAVILPGLYLALRLYHFKVLPLRFIITISNTTESLPFTPLVELLFILILFQILYEVSLRLPQYLGLATSIVGALILGQTGVSAGLISPPGVVIVAMSIISVYTVADEIAQLTVLRALFLIIGGTTGMLGVVGLLLYFVHHLATLDQFGTSYLAPYAPRMKSDMKDGLIKLPVPAMTKRPKSIRTTNKTRQRRNKN